MAKNILHTISLTAILLLLIAWTGCAPKQTYPESITGELGLIRGSHSTLLLADGRVLLFQKANDNSPKMSVEILNPETGKSVYKQMNLTGSLTALPDGNVLVAGGLEQNQINPLRIPDTAYAIKILDPNTFKLQSIGRLKRPRSDHTAVLLNDDTVLFLTGQLPGDFNMLDRSAEVFDYQTRTSSQTKLLNSFRISPKALVLQNGKVLVWHGFERALEVKILFDDQTSLEERKRLNNKYNEFSIELYDPRTKQFTVLKKWQGRELAGNALLLKNGKIMFYTMGISEPGLICFSDCEIKPTNLKITLFDIHTGAMDYRTGPHLDWIDTDSSAVLSSGEIVFPAFDPSKKSRASIKLQGYNPKNGIVRDIAYLKYERANPQVLILKDGRILVSGGAISSACKSENTCQYQAASNYEIIEQY